MWKFLSRLRSWQLFVLSVILFVVDLLVPDPIPFVDEILLGILALLLGRWKRPPDVDVDVDVDVEVSPQLDGRQ